MAGAICDNNQCHLWNEIDKVIPSSRLVSSTVDGADSNEEIAAIFADKFESLYQSIPNDSTEMGSIKDEIKNLIINEDSVNECNVSFRDIDTTVKKLNKRKVDGNHGFYLEHIILSTNKFRTIIVMLVNCMSTYGHNPEGLQQDKLLQLLLVSLLCK